MFAEMATELYNQGLTVQSYLKGLYEMCVFVLCLTSFGSQPLPRYGYFEVHHSLPQFERWIDGWCVDQKQLFHLFRCCQD